MENDNHFVCCCTEQFDENRAERKFHENLSDEDKKQAQLLQ
jgi:hypothetical protein